jgi:hypothetical protein
VCAPITTRGIVSRSVTTNMLSLDLEITVVWIVTAMLAVRHVVLISVGGSEENFLIDGRIER